MTTVIVRNTQSTVEISTAGPQGPAGAAGAAGPAGEGVPTGGTTGQFLSKVDGSDYNTEWTTSSASLTGINDIPDVTISSPATDQLLQWNGSAWINASFALTDLSDGPASITADLFLKANGAGTAIGFSALAISDVATLQSELDNRPTLISGELGPGADLDSISDVTITSAVSGHVVYHNGTIWVNGTLADAGIAAASHAHTLSDISDAGTAAGSDTGDFAAASHNHAATDITSGELADARLSSNVGLLNVGQIWTGGQQFNILYATGSGGGRTSITSLASAGRIVSLADSDGEIVLMSDLTPATNELLVRNAGGTYDSRLIIASDISAGTLADARIAESNVTQHETALAITESQISDLGSYAAASHTHTLSDITDAGTAAGSDTGDFAAASHTHAASDIASGTLADARIAESNVTQHLPPIALAAIRATVDGDGSETTAVTLKSYIETACTVTAASLFADVSGSISVTVKRDRGGETTLGTIALSSSQNTRDTTLSGWTTDLQAGDTLILEFGASTTLARAVLSLEREAA